MTRRYRAARQMDGRLCTKVIPLLSGVSRANRVGGTSSRKPIVPLTGWRTTSSIGASETRNLKPGSCVKTPRCGMGKIGLALTAGAIGDATPRRGVPGARSPEATSRRNRRIRPCSDGTPRYDGRITQQRRLEARIEVPETRFNRPGRGSNGAGADHSRSGQQDDGSGACWHWPAARCRVVETRCLVADARCNEPATQFNHHVIHINQEERQ